MRLMRFVTTTAIAAALAIPAFAQEPAKPATAPMPSAPPSAATTAPKAAAPATTAATTHAARHISATDMRASKMIGTAVYDGSDQKIGSIGDLVVDRDGRVSEVVIGVGSFIGGGDKNIAVKFADLKRGKDNRLVLNTTKDALKQMVAFDLNPEPAARSGSSAH